MNSRMNHGFTASFPHSRHNSKCDFKKITCFLEESRDIFILSDVFFIKIQEAPRTKNK